MEVLRSRSILVTDILQHFPQLLRIQSHISAAFFFQLIKHTVFSLLAKWLLITTRGQALFEKRLQAVRQRTNGACWKKQESCENLHQIEDDETTPVETSAVLTQLVSTVVVC